MTFFVHAPFFLLCDRQRKAADVLPDIIADPTESSRLIFIDYDSKSPTYSKSVTVECDFLSEAVTAWAALTKKNREGAYIRTASDRRFKAGDIKKLQKSPGF